jgi:sugar O-acyltransferase (sialic acid O-acetyltransferase NeuD family)
MKKLAIIGSGDLGQLMAHHATDSGFEVIGYYDDFQVEGSYIKEKIILGNTNKIANDYANAIFDEIIIAIGYKHLVFKEQLFDKIIKIGIPLANIIHSSAYIDKSVVLGKGIFILPNCTLDSGVRLGNCVLLNTGVVIAHDSYVDNFSFLAPAVAMAGYILVGKRCFLGINTTVIDNIQITDDTQTGGGSVITKNITEKGLYVGVPARKIR